MLYNLKVSLTCCGSGLCLEPVHCEPTVADHLFMALHTFKVQWLGMRLGVKNTDFISKVNK